MARLHLELLGGFSARLAEGPPYWLLALNRIYAGQFDAAMEHEAR